MATFGAMVTKAEVMPSSVKSGKSRDLSWLPEYKTAIEELQAESTARGETIVRLASIEPSELKAEKNRLKTAGKALGLALGFRKRAEGAELLFWIEPDKQPALTSYEKDKMEAEKAGLTVAEYKAKKASNGTATGTGRRGRPKKNAEPELATV